MQPEGQRRGPSELDGVPGIWAAQGLEWRGSAPLENDTQTAARR